MYKIYTKKKGIPPGYIHKFLLTMKLTIVLLFITMMQVSATTYAQKISLKKTNASLAQVINEIRNQSGYDFLYDVQLIKKANRVTVDLNNASLEDALKACFYNQPLIYKVEDKAVMIREKMPSFLDNVASVFSNIDVRGRVLDAEGAPLPGAIIKIKGRQSLAMANGAGEFTINVPEGTVIEISFIGYKTQETVVGGNTRSLTITLVQDISKLDEITVEVPL